MSVYKPIVTFMVFIASLIKKKVHNHLKNIYIFINFWALYNAGMRHFFLEGKKNKIGGP